MQGDRCSDYLEAVRVTLCRVVRLLLRTNTACALLLRVKATGKAWSQHGLGFHGVLPQEGFVRAKGTMWVCTQSKRPCNGGDRRTRHVADLFWGTVRPH